MTQYALIKQFIREDETSNNQEKPQVLDISEQYMTLNARMQRDYDEQLEDIGDADCLDKDDSDASHFYISGDDGTYNWWIVEYVTP